MRLPKKYFFDADIRGLHTDSRGFIAENIRDHPRVIRENPRLRKSFRGLFITFEGPEGCGKTTHSKLLFKFLKAKGLKALYTREPGGTVIGEKIREILLDSANKTLGAVSEMLLYMAARERIVGEKISPALRNGSFVICDRFLDSSLAYQGYGGGLDLSLIKRIGELVTKGIKPDITFVLDIDVKEGLKRSGAFKDRIEKRPLAYHERVRKGYLAIAKKEPDRIKVISVRGGIQETQALIRETVKRHLKNFLKRGFSRIDTRMVADIFGDKSA